MVAVCRPRGAARVSSLGSARIVVRIVAAFSAVKGLVERDEAQLMPESKKLARRAIMIGMVIFLIVEGAAVGLTLHSCRYCHNSFRPRDSA